MLESVDLCKESPLVSSSLSDGNPYRAHSVLALRALVTVVCCTVHMDKGVVYKMHSAMRSTLVKQEGP